MTARALMLQGTGSDVGKSLLAAALCRAYARRGLRVRPFKPQNMSNNAAVAASADGRTAGEIGRAQALQARAAGVAPSVDMNPVLLKPTGETGAQVIVHGRPVAQADARTYHALKPTLLPAVLESFARLRAEADLVICEGAGGAAETNLRAGDIANMGFALAADVPVVLVGDVERGGVLAALVGTHALLEPAERALLAGYIVNKFRGDPALFAGAIPIVSERTGLPCLGVVPYVAEADRLPKEDSAGLGAGHRAGTAGAIRIAVPRLPRIANFDDLDPLAAEPGVALTLIEHEPVPADTDVVLLPGSKATRADLDALRARGLDHDILAHRRRGGLVVGLCGGYQMLGRSVADLHGVEGAPGTSPGLGLLDVETELAPAKTLGLAAGIESRSNEPVRGYEIHAGATRGPDTARPMLTLSGGRPDGAVSADGRVMGCYLHGLFAADGFRRAFLEAVRDGTFAAHAWEAEVEAALDVLADRVAAAVDLDRLLALAR